MAVLSVLSIGGCRGTDGRCADGDVEACTKVCDGAGPADPPSVRRACFTAGRSRLLGHDSGPVDEPDALRRFERGCDLGDPDACRVVADRAEAKDDVARRTTFARRACNLGDVPSCQRDAEDLARSADAGPDAAEARIEEACARLGLDLASHPVDAGADPCVLRHRIAQIRAASELERSLPYLDENWRPYEFPSAPPTEPPPNALRDPGIAAPVGTEEPRRPTGARRIFERGIRSSEAVYGPGTEDILRRIVRQSFGRFRACYESLLLRTPGARGTARLRFELDARGLVPSATSEPGPDALRDPDFEGCLVKAHLLLTFPSPRQTTTVVHALGFEPGP
ncbi:MAG: AgmX/PglI C-terminal domain-containing protein [Polyangiaceae bacterium]